MLDWQNDSGVDIDIIRNIERGVVELYFLIVA